MWYWWALVLILLTSAIFLALWYIPRTKKYRDCIKDVDEAIVDIINAVNIIMEGCDNNQKQSVVMETIIKNHLIENIFKSHDVLCINQSSKKWILNEVKKNKDLQKINSPHRKE